MAFEEHVEDKEEEMEIETQIRSENLQAVANSGRRNGGSGEFRYKECMKNQAIRFGGQTVDGCRQFLPAGGEGTMEALKCKVCNCHRNFHRKVLEVQVQQPQETFHHHTPPPCVCYHPNPSGYVHVMTSPPSHNQQEVSNPSSSGGGSKKRFRTKFTHYQKDRMLVFSEALGWRIQKDNEAAVQQFCAEIGISRPVLKVWMHNNKHTLGKKP